MKFFEGKKSIISCFAVFFLFLFVFAYTTFPKKALKQRFIAEVERNTSYSAKVDDVKFYPLLSLKFSGVELFKEAAESINIDSLDVSLSAISLIFSDSFKIPFDARVKDGSMKGNLSYLSNEKSVDSIKAKLDNLDANLIKVFIKSEDNSPSFSGKLDGTIDVSFNNEGNSFPEGSYSFLSDNFSIADIKIDKFPLPDYQGLKAKLEGKLSPGATDINNLELKNDDFELKISGDMPLPWQLKRGGRLNLSYKLLLFSNDAKLSFLKAFAKAQKDGSYVGMISGTVQNPRFKGVNTVKF